MKKVHFGDEGYTTICNERVPKYSPVVEFIGGIQELVSILGLIRAYIMGKSELNELYKALKEVQIYLLSIASSVAMCGKESIFKEHIDNMDKHIEMLWSDIVSRLEPRVLIVPGGSIESSLVYVASAVCRRVERIAAKLLHEGRLGKNSYVYINRLSDLLYVYARYIDLVKRVQTEYYE